MKVERNYNKEISLSKKTEMNSTLDGITGKLDRAEETPSELENT